MGILLCVICCFSLGAFIICCLCLIFVNLINMCLEVFRLGFILFGTLWVSWTWVIISFPILGKFSTIISSSIFKPEFPTLQADSFPLSHQRSPTAMLANTFIRAHNCHFFFVLRTVKI